MMRRGPVDPAIFAKTFEGTHFVMSLRGAREDRHITFSVMYKDDDGYGVPRWWLVGNHYIATEHGVTSVCLEDLATVTAEALAWCKANCDPYTIPTRSGAEHVHGWALRR